MELVTTLIAQIPNHSIKLYVLCPGERRKQTANYDEKSGLFNVPQLNGRLRRSLKGKLTRPIKEGT